MPKSIAEQTFEALATQQYNVYPEMQVVKEETVLQEANRIIYGDREQTYGHPAKNFEATAELWNAYLRAKFGTRHDFDADFEDYVNAKDVAHMMMLLKMARELHQHKRDNIVDMAGYAGCIQKMEDYYAQR